MARYLSRACLDPTMRPQSLSDRPTERIPTPMDAKQQAASAGIRLGIVALIRRAEQNQHGADPKCLPGELLLEQPIVEVILVPSFA
jgi:hypothetical protein